MDDDVARLPEEPEPQPPPQPPRLLLCGSDVPDHDVLLSAAQPWVSVFMVDVGRSLGETAQKLRWYSERAADKSATAANEPFASAALVLVEPHRAEGTIRVTGGEKEKRARGRESGVIFSDAPPEGRRAESRLVGALFFVGALCVSYYFSPADLLLALSKRSLRLASGWQRLVGRWASRLAGRLASRLAS